MSYSLASLRRQERFQQKNNDGNVTLPHSARNSINKLCFIFNFVCKRIEIETILLLNSSDISVFLLYTKYISVTHILLQKIWRLIFTVHRFENKCKIKCFVNAKFYSWDTLLQNNSKNLNYSNWIFINSMKIVLKYLNYLQSDLITFSYIDLAISSFYIFRKVKYNDYSRYFPEP